MSVIGNHRPNITDTKRYPNVRGDLHEFLIRLKGGRLTRATAETLIRDHFKDKKSVNIENVVSDSREKGSISLIVYITTDDDPFFDLLPDFAAEWLRDFEKTYNSNSKKLAIN